MAWEDWIEDERAEREAAERAALVAEVGEEEVLRREAEAAYEKSLTVGATCTAVVGFYSLEGELLEKSLYTGTVYDMKYAVRSRVSILEQAEIDPDGEFVSFRIESYAVFGRKPKTEARLKVETLYSRASVVRDAETRERAELREAAEVRAALVAEEVEEN